jgi:very-short-patch-repair endonuclease
MVVRRKKWFAKKRHPKKRAKGKAKFQTTPGKRKRNYSYEDHGVKRFSNELAPCDDKRKEKIILRDYVDSKGKLHKAHIHFNRTTLSSSGKKRKQTNYAILEFDYVNRALGVVAEIDGIGHYSGMVWGGHAYLAGRENDIIKEKYCEAMGWILVRISNLKGGNVDLKNEQEIRRIMTQGAKGSDMACCGWPEFNRRIDIKLKQVRGRLGTRAPPRGVPILRTVTPCIRKVSRPSTPIVRQRKVDRISRNNRLEEKMLRINSL